MVIFMEPIIQTEAVVTDWVENTLVRGVLLEIEKNIRLGELKLQQKVSKRFLPFLGQILLDL